MAQDKTASDKAQASLRIDKWLWYARFFKSRSLASKICEKGAVRVNKQAIKKAHYALKVGDVVTFEQGPFVRVIEVKALGARRGPAVEAQQLYNDLAPPKKPEPEDQALAQNQTMAQRPAGSGRPTKKERRQLDAFLDSSSGS